MFLDMLPFEIRAIIYKKLLISIHVIQDAHKLVDGGKKSLRASDHVFVDDVESTILRTCRVIYEEAGPILYKQNHFYFCSSSDMADFAFNGLMPSSTARRDRLSRISTMTLKLGPKRIELRIQGRQEKLMSYWSGGFYNRKSRSPRFSALEKLSLDFSGWNLTPADEDALRVKPIIKMFGASGGLQELILRGVMHDQNLHDLKHGLVKRGGRFAASYMLGGPDIIVVTIGKDD